MTYYYNCRLVDGTGSAAIENAVLITEGTKIVYAGPAATAPAAGEAKKLDMAGRPLLPGIFNCHVHMALRFPFTPYCVDEYGTRLDQNTGIQIQITYIEEGRTFPNQNVICKPTV